METPVRDTLEELEAAIDAGCGSGSMVAFQSTLAAAAETVDQALARVHDAEAAALSLAQSELLGEMRQDLELLSERLHAAITPPGESLLSRPQARKPRLMRRLRRERVRHSTGPAWPQALHDATRCLGDAADRMRHLAAGQPLEAPSRRLARAVSEMLSEHHERLASRTTHWSL